MSRIVLLSNMVNFESVNLVVKVYFNNFILSLFLSHTDCRVRLVTLELSIRLLTDLVMKGGQSYLHDCHLAAIEGAKEESTCLLRNFYKVRCFWHGIGLKY